MEMSRWYPFRFRRQRNGEHEEQQSKSGSSMEMMPREMMSREMMRNPMAMMRQMMSDPFFDPMSSAMGPMAMSRQMMPEQWFGDFSQPFFEPKVDVVDMGKSVRVTAELPGLSRDDVDVEVQEGSLILSGHKAHEESKEEEGYYRAERSYGSFRRVIPMPEDLNFDKCDARFSDGVLNITVPKRSNGKAKTSRIDVKS